MSQEEMMGVKACLERIFKENGRGGLGNLWHYIAISNYWKGCFVHEAKIETSFDK